jgi:hypothetical protein
MRGTSKIEQRSTQSEQRRGSRREFFGGSRSGRELKMDGLSGVVVRGHSAVV